MIDSLSPQRLIKDLQSQIESIEQEASRKSSIKAYETGAGATTRQKWTEASLAEAYDKLDDAFIRLQVCDLRGSSGESP